MAPLFKSDAEGLDVRHDHRLAAGQDRAAPPAVAAPPPPGDMGEVRVLSTVDMILVS